ncbi:zinc-binding dehydrogenase [bacterium]|nr:zinc-binding dehydrogenase [bacterium]
MKAVVLRDIGSLEKLSYEDVAFPIVKSGEAVVRVKAAALNHRDWWIVQGLYAKIKVPVILGSDGAGEVVNVGDPKDEGFVGKQVVIHPSLSWGDNSRAQSKDFRILGMPDNGTLAEYVTVPLSNIFEKPEYLTDEESAALPLGGLTAYRALFVQGKLQEKDVVLITGIGGGVASLAMQMALAAGAIVMVTSGHEEKIQRAVKAGIAFGSNYNDEDFFKKLTAAAESYGGIDLIIDSAGGKGFGDLMALIKPGGRIVNFGATAGNPESFDLRKMFWKQITLQGSTMGTHEDFGNMIAFFRLHRIKPLIDKVFLLKDVVNAFQRMKDGIQFGKIVLKP